ncbi:protein PSK SIMULATOR 1 isoform X2 [Impatiens glandulifera]|uniref:protein PSK SIMULATOR 1 isoform X2 n=1 Tax=Impatiens glandulifera TaxID=253017 RepID=UPI001FB12937|nr:protein PSK SIMULATOR 1 isoform X2 [Impatiens glandulifera]
MGGICSRRSTDDASLAAGFPNLNGRFNYASRLVYGSQVDPPNNEMVPPSFGEPMEKKKVKEPFEPPQPNIISYQPNADEIYDGIPRLPRALSNKTRSTTTKQAVAKVSEMSSLIGKAGSVGLGKAVDVLDTLGSGMTNLNMSSTFVSGVTKKGNKIKILAFEVANTIVKGANLMQSLSKENITHLKESVLLSEGVQWLVSKDMDELLRIAAADKRDELKVFSREVVRFGNRCKDPQWHNLDRYFDKLESEFISEKPLKDDAENMMQQLMTLVQYTADLYHEMHALDRFEQDYRRKLQEENNSTASQKGDGLAIFKAELKNQNKHVKSLMKKSLWSWILEEVMEKLVDIVHFIHSEISDAFGNVDGNRPIKNNQKLGSAGLALHYANIISQIDTLVTRSSSIPPNTRDALYQGLPPNIKSALRPKLQSFQPIEDLSLHQIKAEMEKTLRWLVPIANNTTKAHHGFGWVGEWANTGKATGQIETIKLETLHHADKEKVETHILELIVWLHYLISQSRSSTNNSKSPIKSPIRSPNQFQARKSSPPSLSVEDQQMLRDVNKRKLTPGISKSQEFDTAKTRLMKKHNRLSKSSSHSPTYESMKDHRPIHIRRPLSLPVIDFAIDKLKALDVIDRVDTVRSL